MVKGRIVMGLLFFPRGGSAQVARYLAAALCDDGWGVSLASGSAGEPGEGTNAATFFEGLDVQPLDYSPALRAFAAGGSAMAAPVPMHPSYEDREGAPDVVLPAVDPTMERKLSSIWEAPFVAAGADGADLFHLHHLTPQHDTVERRWPHVPVVAHLHGTEIKLIEAINERTDVATALGTTLAAMPAQVREASGVPPALDERQSELWWTTRWDQWQHGDFWRGRLLGQAAGADHLVVVSPPDRATATDVLGVDPALVTDVPNGVEIDRFHPRLLGAAERRAAFRRWLVEDPQGWDESGVPGSVAYREPDLDRLLGRDGDATVLVFVGRFTSAKRVPVLIRAFARARTRFERPTSLLVWGGHPGEWEDEHPVTVARQVGQDGIFFSGWRGHEDLPLGLAASDVLVMPSVNDSFAQTPLEAMAVGLPVVATLSGGFPSMINVGPVAPTGWLVEPDDVEALADGLVEAVHRLDERRRRGAAALTHARAHLSWAGRVAGFEAAYAAAKERHARSARDG